jgi:putative membrane protein
MKLLPLISLIGLGSASLAFGQAETPQWFVSTAAQDGMVEVELGKLASAKAQSPKVKAFANRMVTDHGKANTELEVLARGKGLQVPKKLDAQHQSMVDMLNGELDLEFDAAYMQHMAKAHAKAVALFERASRLNDPELAGFAQKTLPMLQEHKRMADTLNVSVGKPRADSSGA